MKLQGMSIIFALVIVPIILVVSYYIQLQVDTINLQTAYDTKLLDSTYDAMAAFELNTANEDLSTVSDSLRTIIEASYNVFINNLSTNLGMSNANKSYVEPYIPSVLFTLYDGYYICAPTKVPTVLTDSNGNAISVGDKGVTGTSGSYTFNEGSDNLCDKSVGLDYGQLLYLKKGTTNTYTANIEEAELEIKNVLKTYMPYSARYVDAGYDLTIIYTLDNYVTIEGTIGNVYYTKSGYLIPDGSVEIKIENITDIPDGSTDINLYNQNDIQDIIESRKAKFSVIVKDGTDTTITLEQGGRTKAELNTKLNVLNNTLKDAQEIWHTIAISGSSTGITNAEEKFTTEYIDNLNANYDFNYTGGLNFGSDSDAVSTLSSIIKRAESEITNTQYELDTISSVVYYAKAYVFSKWVNDYLCGTPGVTGGCKIAEENIEEVAGQQYTTIKGIETLEFDFKESNANVFDLTGTEPVSVTEIPSDCGFYQHKLNVIKMSIQYNLNLAMSTYNNNESYLFEYEMPVISASEWEQILTHISITSFMQGLKCGLKTYNNYKIVSSTNNDILVLPEEVYYVKKEEFNDEESEYHKINCDKLIDNDADGVEYMAFSSKEVKYDKVYNNNRDHMTYEYDHKNFACYDCINDGNYFNYDSTGDGTNDTQINIFNKADTTNYNKYKNLRKAYYLGVAKERNDTYKMNAVINSQGYEILKCDTPGGGKTNPVESSLGADKIKAIEIAIGTIYSQNATIRTAIYSFGYGSADNLSNDTYSIATNNSSNDSTQSLKITIVPGKNVGSSKFSVNSFNEKIKCENYEEILSMPNALDEEGNPIGQKNAIEQFKNAIKYVRVIYK